MKRIKNKRTSELAGSPEEMQVRSFPIKALFFTKLVLSELSASEQDQLREQRQITKKCFKYIIIIIHNSTIIVRYTGIIHILNILLIDLFKL